MTRAMKESGIEWIGAMPDNWKIAKVKTGLKSIKTKAMIENPTILSLTSKGVTQRDISSNEGQIAQSYYNYNPVKKGDLLLNPMDLVTNAFSAISELEGVISPAYFNLQCMLGYYNKYYDYYFKLQYWGLTFFAHGKGVSKENRWTLNHETLKNYPMPVPSFTEQKAIAKYLDEKCALIDSIIEKQNTLIEKLKAYKQSVITEAVTKGLDRNAKMKDSEIEWIGEIPEGWEVKSLRYIAQCQNGISKGAEFFGKGYPFVSYGDVYKDIELPASVDGLVDSTEKERQVFSVRKGDVFFTRTSETIEEIGLTSTCIRPIENATFAGFLIRVRPYEGIVFEGFTKYYFRSDIHRKYFVKEMNLVTRASLSQGLLKKLPVLIPPSAEQKEIALFLDKKCTEINRIISRKLNTINKLSEYKKSLIYECVTGKREVV